MSLGALANPVVAVPTCGGARPMSRLHRSRPRFYRAGSWRRPALALVVFPVQCNKPSAHLAHSIPSSQAALSRCQQHARSAYMAVCQGRCMPLPVDHPPKNHCSPLLRQQCPPVLNPTTELVKVPSIYRDTRSDQCSSCRYEAMGALRITVSTCSSLSSPDGFVGVSRRLSGLDYLSPLYFEKSQQSRFHDREHSREHADETPQII